MVCIFFSIRNPHYLFIYSDVDSQAIPPQWPPTPESLRVDDGVYELRAVPLTSITLVTNKVVKVSTSLQVTCIINHNASLVGRS